MNASWMETIGDSTLCGYFYVFFIIFSALAGLSILGAIWMVSTTKITTGVVAMLLFAKLINIGICGTAALFLYLICERALKPKAAVATHPMM